MLVDSCYFSLRLEFNCYSLCRPSKPKKKRNPYALPDISLEDLDISQRHKAASKEGDAAAGENKKKLAEGEADEEEDDMQHFRLNEQTLPAFQVRVFLRI